MPRYECGTAAETGCRVVGPDDPDHTIWNYPRPAATSGERALVIGDPDATAYAVTGTLFELERFVSKAMARLRAARAGELRRHPAPAVTFEPAALADWLAQQLATSGLTGAYTPRENIAARLESLIFALRSQPQLWRTAPDIGAIAVYPTGLAEADVADFGAVLTVEATGLRLATPHLSAGDLTGLYWDGAEPPTMPWVQAAQHAITVAADAVNELVARWRLTTGSGHRYRTS